MQLKGKKILLTGAAGGMGEVIASELAALGAKLVLTDRNEPRLQEIASSLPGNHEAVVADLCDKNGINNLVSFCEAAGDIDILINAAGVSDYVMFQDQPDNKIELTIQLNLMTPIRLCQRLLPVLCSRPEAAIVNIGSTFGAIGHPGFTTYCASKFGLRGFTEALRRELADTKVQVFYVAPRATRTELNSEAVVQLNQELGNTMDYPDVVVRQLLSLLTRKSGGAFFLGWPEKLFVRLNGLLPTVVDAALGKQLATIKRLAG
jgi:short-subunit dehydrogenase